MLTSVLGLHIKVGFFHLMAIVGSIVEIRRLMVGETASGFRSQGQLEMRLGSDPVFEGPTLLRTGLGRAK